MERALILLDNGFQDAEVLYPLYRLREAGIAVDLVAPERKAEYTGKYGYRLTSDLAVSSVKPDKYGIVVIPGGEAPAALVQDPAAVKLVRQADLDDITIAAICKGPLVCAAADILANRNVTSFDGVKAELKKAGAIWEDAAVVVDGNLVTSRKPDDLPDFMKQVLRIARKGIVNF